MGFYQPNSSLTYYALDPLVNVTICILIIVGGIGFFVWDDLWKHRHHFKLYQLHTKVVLSATGFLLIAGTAGFYILERNSLLSGHTIPQQIMEAFFCSVTPRTAGFNTVDTGALSSASMVLVLFLMFVGGSPGSVSGGIKTTTFVVLILSAYSSLRNKKEEAIFGRLLESDSLRRATTVMLLNSIMIWIATLLLAADNADIALDSLLFEAVSAISTVGLSTGITAGLTDFSRFILIALMYFGRVGSLSFAHIFAEQRINSLIKYPTGKLTIG
jgi:trk system potassium uptake protein TrkH